jgi:hypothetical protein
VASERSGITRKLLDSISAGGVSRDQGGVDEVEKLFGDSTDILKAI